MPATPQIEILPEHVVHKIAAGEVVERPVSVVKELVENSLDAGATRIHVALELGGCKAIRVEDDGHGIASQQLALALKRHATSKIRAAEDLFALNTLGFRGEALPAIASTGDFRLESATQESDPLGYALDVRAGRVGDLQEVALNRGTRIVLKNLFSTTPARLKFLKRPETEWSHVSDFLTAMALHRLDVEWRLEHNGKTSLFCPRVDDPKRRILDLFGRETMEVLYPLERRVSGVSLKGLIGHPNFSKKSNRNLYVFVNGRLVQDRLINHAIVSGYRGLLMTQQYPMAVLHIDIDPSRVDVNVHPTKREVRFSDSNVIHHLISETIRHHLDQAPWKQAETAFAPGESAPTGWDWPAASVSRASAGDDPQERVRAALDEFLSRSPRNESWPASFSASELIAKQAKVGMLDFQELRLIGQFDATYLVCESRGSLLLIDQHAAHERIGFEQLKKSYLTGRLAQQSLLTPLTFNFAEGEAAKLRSCLEEMEKFGFSIDEFGENTFVLKAHPILLKDCDWSALLREVAEGIEESPLAGLEERIDHVLATMACHRQVRAHQRLADDEMRSLLKDLEGTPRSYHCPHGRPVMVEVASEEIQKWFKRIV